jgi:hypothetical protein
MVIYKQSSSWREEIPRIKIWKKNIRLGLALFLLGIRNIFQRNLFCLGSI